MPEEKQSAEATRPEPGTYPTFTSRKKASTVCLQKPRYGTDDFKVRRLVDDKVTITIQDGVEFDAWRECLGDPDTVPLAKRFKGNPYFVKLVNTGYLRRGELVKLAPETLQRFLEAQAHDEVSTNKIIPWKDRKRSEKELELEGVIEGHKAISKKQAADIVRMREILKKNNIPFEPKA